MRLKFKRIIFLTLNSVIIKYILLCVFYMQITIQTTDTNN